jgi:DNA-binding transcriptional LysR family regulator
VEIISDDRVLSLAGREADIALRPKRPTEETLVARRIATIRWGIYAGKETCDSLGRVKNLTALAGRKFVNWEGGPASAWFDETIPGTRSPIISSSLITNAALAAQSNLLVSLPCLLGSLWPNLGTVLAPLPEPVGELWVATHEDMRSNARVKALFDYLVTAAETEKRIFEGRK